MAASMHEIQVDLGGTTMDRIVEKIAYVTDKHHLGDGAYCRWLWQNDRQNRQLGINEYGCADAVNILYTIGNSGYYTVNAQTSGGMSRMQKIFYGIDALTAAVVIIPLVLAFLSKKKKNAAE